jgi:hypothetical protein
VDEINASTPLSRRCIDYKLFHTRPASIKGENLISEIRIINPVEFIAMEEEI